MLDALLKAHVYFKKCKKKTKSALSDGVYEIS
jgi:hypothetical protein